MTACALHKQSAEARTLGNKLQRRLVVTSFFVFAPAFPWKIGKMPVLASDDETDRNDKLLFGFAWSSGAVGTKEFRFARLLTPESSMLQEVTGRAEMPVG